MFMMCNRSDRKVCFEIIGYELSHHTRKDKYIESYHLSTYRSKIILRVLFCFRFSFNSNWFISPNGLIILINRIVS